jgi:hypothetical protein
VFKFSTLIFILFLFSNVAFGVTYADRFEKRAVERLVHPLEKLVQTELKGLDKKLRYADHQRTNEILKEEARLKDFLETQRTRLLALYRGLAPNRLSLEESTQELLSEANHIILLKKELDAALDAGLPIVVESANKGEPFREPAMVLQVREHRKVDDIAQELQAAIEKVALLSMKTGELSKLSSNSLGYSVSVTSGIVFGNYIMYLLGGYASHYSDQQDISFLMGSTVGGILGATAYKVGILLLTPLHDYFIPKLKGSIVWRRFLKRVEAGFVVKTFQPLEWLVASQLRSNGCERMLSSEAMLQFSKNLRNYASSQ